MRVAILSNNEVIRQGLCVLLRESGGEPAFDGALGDASVEAICELDCTDAIVGVVGADEAELVSACRHLSDCGVIVSAVCTAGPVPGFLPSLVDAGLSNFVNVQGGPGPMRYLLAALDCGRTIFEGLPVDGPPRSGAPGSNAEAIDPVDVSILRQLAKGDTSRQAANRLDMSESYLKRRVCSLERKHGARSRFQLAVWAQRKGILRMSDVAPKRARRSSARS